VTETACSFTPQYRNGDRVLGPAEVPLNAISDTAAAVFATRKLAQALMGQPVGNSLSMYVCTDAGTPCGSLRQVAQEYSLDMCIKKPQDQSRQRIHMWTHCCHAMAPAASKRTQLPAGLVFIDSLMPVAWFERTM